MRTRESHACLDGKHRGRLFVSLSLPLSLSLSLPYHRQAPAAGDAGRAEGCELLVVGGHRGEGS